MTGVKDSREHLPITGQKIKGRRCQGSLLSVPYEGVVARIYEDADELIVVELEDGSEVWLHRTFGDTWEPAIVKCRNCGDVFDVPDGVDAKMLENEITSACESLDQ